MIIRIDTREQKPWAFEGYDTVRATINAGDYAIDGDNGFAIERKALADYVDTIACRWDRFQRELSRMAEAGFPARIVIVEGTTSGLIARCDGRQFTAPFLFKRTAELTMAGVSVLFAGDAFKAEQLARCLLRQRWQDLKFAGVVVE